MSKFPSACLLFLALVVAPLGFGLQKSDQQPARPGLASSAEKKTPPKFETTTARLMSAKNVFIIRSEGNNIPMTRFAQPSATGSASRW